MTETEPTRTGQAGTAQLDWIEVCTLDDLPEVGAVQADFDGRMVAIARDSAGTVHAFDDTCTHGFVSLSEGEVDGGEIECWLHGSRFDMTTGTPTSLPATRPVVVHHVRIEGQQVLVALSPEPEVRPTG